jgi:hypothetical protein
MLYVGSNQPTLLVGATDSGGFGIQLPVLRIEPTARHVSVPSLGIKQIHVLTSTAQQHTGPTGCFDTNTTTSANTRDKLSTLAKSFGLIVSPFDTLSAGLSTSDLKDEGAIGKAAAALSGDSTLCSDLSKDQCEHFIQVYLIFFILLDVSLISVATNPN